MAAVAQAALESRCNSLNRECAKVCWRIHSERRPNRVEVYRVFCRACRRKLQRRAALQGLQELAGPKQATAGAACARPRQRQAKPDQDCCCCLRMSLESCCCMMDWGSHCLTLCRLAMSCTGTSSRLMTRSCCCCCSMKVTDWKGYSSCRESCCSRRPTTARRCYCCPRKRTAMRCRKGRRLNCCCEGRQESLNWTSWARSRQTPGCTHGASCRRGCSSRQRWRLPYRPPRPGLRAMRGMWQMRQTRSCQMRPSCFLCMRATQLRPEQSALWDSHCTP